MADKTVSSQRRRGGYDDVWSLATVVLVYRYTKTTVQSSRSSQYRGTISSNSLESESKSTDGTVRA